MIRQRIGAVVLALSLVAAGCGDDSDEVAAEPSDDTAGDAQEEAYEGEVGVTDDTITLGMLTPKTGPYAVAGGETGAVNELFRTAAEEVNADGGIHGRMIEIKEYDDGSGNPATTQASVRAAKDEVFGLVSIIGNTSTVAAPLVEDYEMPLIVGNIDGRVARSLRYTFGSIPFWDTSARIMPGYIANELDAAGEKIGVIYMNTPNGDGARAAFEEAAGEEGLEIAVTQPVEAFPSTCNNEVSKLAAADVTVVFMITASFPAICMLRAAEAAGFEPTWTTPAYGWNLDLVSKGTDGLTDGVIAFGYGATFDTDAGQEYVDSVERFGTGETAYDSNELLLHGMWKLFFAGLEAAGENLTRDGFVEAMETEVSGVDTGFLPPPTYEEGNHQGPLVVNLWRGEDKTWVMEDPTWHESF